jgi:signal transduction histidine kinase
MQLDLLRERHTRVTLEFHLQRVLHDLANHFHAIKLRITYLEQTVADRELYAEVLASCGAASAQIETLAHPAASAPDERTLLGPLLEAAAALARRDGGEVLLAPGLDQLPPVTGSADELAVMFVHLFDNAREARGRVRVEGHARDGQIILRVSDDGRGIPEELARKIWKPFFTTKDGHHGHGLALARQILRRAGGSIELENGRGAVFLITQPAR